MRRRIRWYIHLIDLSLPSVSAGPIKTYVFFFVACVILQIIFKFRFSQYAYLCEQVGFLLRQSHLLNINNLLSHVYSLAKFKPHMPITFGVTALQSSNDRKIDLYNKDWEENTGAY